MAIKERKQITGTEAQIKGYAGHNGVLAYATDTKHLHVLSGTAGTTTKLANVSDIPAPVDISGKADKTYVDTELAKKQAKGDYATTSALTSGLAGKANSSHTHTKSQITDFPSIPDTSTLIPKSGARGNLAGYETTNTDISSGESITINRDSPDSQCYTLEGITSNQESINVEKGATGETWTKTVYIVGDYVTVGLASKWKWAGGSIPIIKCPGVLVLHWNNTGGIANYVGGVS